MSKESKTQLPEFLRPYFWDVAFDKIDVTKYPQFVLKRVLDRGDTKAVLWAITLFDNNSIAELITTSRDLSAKTANFWADMLGIDKHKVPCLQKPYSRILFGPSS
ncbi:MAG: hypothetical protein HY429_04325 [Candidatus Levybacteria bacterium]|nr:hypothetical protein [Candidatus Levybacteria bacterium]